MINIAVFISGRGSNFMALHENIKNGKIKNAQICAVFSNNPDAAGLKYAEENDLPVIVISSKGRKDRELYDKEILNAIAPYKPDLICLAGYMRIVTPVLVSAFKIMNIHPALLPAFPGLDAQKQALNRGVRFGGCTVHFVDAGVDTGPIILQAVVPVHQSDTEEALSERILKEEHKIYSEAVALFAAGRLKVSENKVIISE